MRVTLKSRSLLRLANALLATVLAVLAGCAGGPDRHEESAAAVGDPGATPDSNSVIAGYAPAVLSVRADEILTRVSDGRGATLVNVWATWCTPCRREMPSLLRVARAHRQDGLRLMLVSADFDDQIPAVRRFLATHAVDETTFIKTGDDNTFINALHQDWSGALPATLIFNRAGQLTDFWEGAADENRFEHAVIAALSESPLTEATR